MANVGGLQLLPETRKRIEVNIPGENRMLRIGVILCIIIALISGGLFWYRNSLSQKLANADQDLTALEGQRNKKGEENLLTLHRQIDLISQLLKNHLYWSIGFSKVESLLQSNVQFKSISSNVSDATFAFRATANDYPTLAKQLAAFVADNSVKDVSLGGVTVLTNGKLDFSARIQFNPTEFLKAK
ncbi:hypothetical protein KW791_01755 [Candidatus Parcubacteria bacterium]|nr:hypothetical protein [Candidatus Parcubacteria bacterium]